MADESENEKPEPKKMPRRGVVVGYAVMVVVCAVVLVASVLTMMGVLPVPGSVGM